MTELKITGKSRAKILAALYNHSAPIGMGFFAAVGAPPVFSEANAQKILDQIADRMAPHVRPGTKPDDQICLDYVAGRPIKISFDRRGEDDFLTHAWLYDRDNGGDGTCAALVERVTS